jgi:hypothetical protein
VKFEKDDFVVVKVEGKTKNKLVKVLSKEGDTLTVRVEGSKVKRERVTEEVQIQMVVVNLGPEPAFGQVYGCNVEPFISSTDTDWGPMHYYRKLEQEQKEKIKKSLKRCWTRLDQLKLTGFAPVVIEIRNGKGPEDGYYRVHKQDDVPDVLCLKPSDFAKENLDEILYHEAAHGLAFNTMPEQIWVRWIKLYTYYTKMGELTAKDLKAIQHAIETAGSFSCGLDKDQLTACLAAVSANYGVRKHELKLMLEHNQSLDEIWPTHTLDMPDCEVPIREYSMKNCDEFFADAFAYHLMGKQLPKKIKRLLEETISALKGREKE